MAPHEAEKLCIAKNTVIQAKWQPTWQKKISMNYTPDRELVSRIYKESNKKP